MDSHSINPVEYNGVGHQLPPFDFSVLRRSMNKTHSKEKSSKPSQSVKSEE